jgi:hypothetical protein
VRIPLPEGLTAVRVRDSHGRQSMVLDARWLAAAARR